MAVGVGRAAGEAARPFNRDRLTKESKSLRESRAGLGAH